MCFLSKSLALFENGYSRITVKLQNLCSVNVFFLGSATTRRLL